MLQNGPGLVLLDALWHHVQDVMHHGCSQLQIEVGLDPLLGDRFGDALGMSSLELTRQKVSEPSLQKRGHTAHEKEPNSPAWCPKSTPGAFSDGSLKMSILFKHK